MGVSNKILVGLFLVFLLISIGELGYYFFYQPAPVNSPTPPAQQTQNYTPSSPTPNPNQAVPNEVLSELSLIKKGNLKSSVLSSTYRGTISELNSNANVAVGGVTYKVILKIKGDQNLTNTFYYNDEDLSRMKFTKVVDGTDQPMNLSDLKPGDSIAINEVIDLVSSSPYGHTVEITITKI